MYKNKNGDRNNICGTKIAALRKAMVPAISQNKFAKLVQLEGLDVDKNAIQRIEAGKRFVTDIELRAIASLFGVTMEYMTD